MIYLLDTNAVSDLMAEQPRVYACLLELTPRDCAVVTPVVREEILPGVSRLKQGRRRRPLRRKASQAFQALPCLPMDEVAADHYARIKLAQQRAGVPLNENDLWSAAAAREHEATLVTRYSHFAQVADLDIVNWSID